MSARVTPSLATVSGKTTSTQRRLLWLGIIAPLLFGIVFMIDGQFKAGYSAYAEAISYLEVGAYGWIQQANFILFGLLLLAFMVGYAQRMRPILGQGWLYAAVTFLLLSDLGWIMAGLFIPNPFLAPQFIWPVVLHQIAFVTVLFPLSIAEIILGVRFVLVRGWRVYGCYSLIIGLLQAAFSIISILNLINPALVSSIVGNPNSPASGLTNRIQLLIGVIAWYIIGTIIVMMRTKQALEPSLGMEE